MIKHIGSIVIGLLVLAALGLSIVAYTVPSTEVVLLKTFGQVTETYNGDDPAQAGLKFKVPLVQQAVHFDARTFILEDALAEFPTRDEKQMLAQLFCAWRVADPKKVDTSVRTIETAQQRLGDLLRNARKVLSEYEMAAYVSTDETKMLLADIERRIEQDVRATAAEKYGLEVVMVGIKRLALPEAVSQDVIDTMIKERQEQISTYRATGESQALAITEQARSAAEQIKAFADKQAVVIKAEGEAAARRYYEAFRGHEALSKFLRDMEALKTILSDRVVLILDPSVLAPLGWFSSGAPVDQVAGDKTPSE